MVPPAPMSPQSDVTVNSVAVDLGVNEQENQLVLTDTGHPTGVDGGFEAWTVLIGSTCAIFATYGLLASNGLLLNHWASNQLSHHSNTMVSWITATHTFLTFFLGGQAGTLFDRFGARPLLIPGSIMYVGGLFLTGQCTVYWHFMLAYGVLAGAGCGITSSVALAVIVHRFSKRRGLAMGVVFAGSSVGGVTFPFIMRNTFQKLIWANSMRVIGSIVLAMVIIANICIKGHLKVRTKGFVQIHEFFDPKFLSVTLGLGTFEFALFGTLGLLPEVAQHLNYSSGTRFTIVAVINGCSGLGRVACGILSDHIGSFNTMIVSALCSIISVFAFWLPSEYNVVLLYFFAVNFGFWSGSMISIGPTCVARLCKIEQFGQYYGISYSITSFVNLICVPIGTRLLDGLGMKGFASIFGSILIISAVSFCITRWAVLKYHWNWIIKI